MQKSVLFVGDPLNSLSFNSDSSLALAEAALELGYQVHWATPEQIMLMNGDVAIQQFELIKEINSQSAPTSEFIDAHTAQRLSDYQRVFIRKDPPFDEGYTELCWFLHQMHAHRVINAPLALLSHHEKMLPYTLTQAGVVPDYMVVPSFVAQNHEHLVSGAEQLFDEATRLSPILAHSPSAPPPLFKVLIKPWRGHGGRDIHVFDSVAQLKSWLSTAQGASRTMTHSGRWILQPFLPEIFTHGDRRVFVANGRVVFDFVRRPADGKVEANLAQGGSAHLEPLPSELQKLANDIAAWLKKEGILLAGLDFIGNFLTEVNITSPTGIRTFEMLSQQNVSGDIMKELLI